MDRATLISAHLVFMILLLGMAGCENKSSPPPKPVPGSPTTERIPKPAAPTSPSPAAPGSKPSVPSGHPPMAPVGEKPPGSADTTKTPAAAAAGATIVGSQLKLAAVTMTVPDGWVSEPVKPGPMAPQAVFRIPKTDPAGEDGVVRVTHFPAMKGKDKDDMNIDRWISQVTTSDGKPCTRADAKITVTELGNVRLTVVDLSGTVKITGWPAAKPDHRMVAAIVDHPMGPHFVAAAGPVKAMETWAAQVDAFLKSAKAE